MRIEQVFLVGCPRSGTTLLQSMLASHPNIVSFPETRFFSKTIPINPLLRQVKLYGPKNKSVVQQFLRANGYQTIRPFKDDSPYRLIPYHEWCQKLMKTLRRMIIRDAPDHVIGPVWGLEKSPRHLHFISSIEQGKSGNKYLHILRHGPDVVASMYLVTQQYPYEWNGKRSVNKCIKWWNSSMKTSLKYRGNSNHLFIIYDQLLRLPEKVLQSICQFLNIEYQKTMIDDFHQTANTLMSGKGKWHSRNEKRLLTKSHKLEKYFDADTRNHIKNKTLDIDLTQFYR